MHDSKKADALFCLKLEFEDFTAHVGVSIKAIWVENGVYTANVFKRHVIRNIRHLLLCSRGPVAEWNHGKIHWQCYSACLYHFTTHYGIVANNCHQGHVAICHPSCGKFHNISIRHDKDRSPWSTATLEFV